jgi:putative MATE family efflux protein
MIRNMLKDRLFFATLLTLGIPVVIQNLFTSFLNMVDVVMIGRLGEVSISAVGLANQLFFILILLLYGTNSGGAIFVSQFWGCRERQSIHKTLGVSLTISILGAVLFTAAALFFPAPILSLFTRDPEVIRVGVEYLQIVCWCYLFTAISFCFAISSRSVGDAKLPMKSSIISFGVNTALNWVLIFGYLGFPALGVKGAALATVIARLVELAIITTYVFSTDHPLRGKLSAYFKFSRAFAGRVLQKSFPVIANEFLWAIGMSLYVAAFARSGTDNYAAYQIAGTIDRLFFVGAFGIGSSAAVMIGNKLGENQREEAILYSRYFNILAVACGFLLGGLLILIAPYVSQFFNVGPEVKVNAARIMIVTALYMPLKVANTLQIIGTLRGGGDTTYSLIMEISSVYLIGVPLAFLAAGTWQLPIYIVIALVNLEEISKALMGFIRLFSNKWANVVIEGMS